MKLKTKKKMRHMCASSSLTALFLLLFLAQGYSQTLNVPWTWVNQLGSEPAGLDTATVPLLTQRLMSPVMGDLDNDGDMDMLTGSRHGRIFYFENTGTVSNPEWVLTPHPAIDTILILPAGSGGVNNEVKCRLVDIDTDGDLDLFIHARFGYAGFKLDDIIYFENIGTSSNAVFNQSTIPGIENQNLGEFGGYAFPDIDNDGDLDFVSLGSDSLSYLENVGTATVPSFQRRTGAANPFDGFSDTQGLYGIPSFKDYDNDGDLDMVYGNDAGFVRWLPNFGTAAAPNFAPYVNFPIGGGMDLPTGDMGNFVSGDFADVTGDGFDDIIHGSFNPVPGFTTNFVWYKAFPTCTDQTATINVTTCDSYRVPSGDEIHTTSGTYMDTIPTVLGCDSILTINLTLNFSTTSTLNIAECSSYTVPSGDETYTATGTYSDTIPNMAGCDSIITINLTINSNTGVDAQVACDTYTWIDGNTYTSSNTTATHTLTNAAGCDSVVTLNLTINNSSTGVDTQVACDTYTWIDGNTYTSSNSTATHTLTNAVGCDSVVTLNLTINNSSTGIDTQVACDSYMWIDGNTYTSSNTTATHTLTNAVGCDSVVTLNLTINNSNTGVDTQVACDSYMWIDGNTYTSSNTTATHTLTNAAGCDSVVTLNLTINNSNTGVDTQVACDTYTWIDGNTYTSSNNTATHTLTNAAGCDSVVTLNLTINNSSTGVDTQVACDSYTWIDGNTYTSSNNTATHTLTNAVGCDSVVTLNLTINNSSTGVDTQVACDSYTWIDGNTYTSSNSTATHTLTNAVGCDSVVTLNLTINNSNTGVDTQVACDSFTWIDGNTYTSSNNTATHTLTNAAGCDSVVTLNLTINTTTMASITEIACDSYTVPSGDETYTTTGIYMDTIPNGSGCDSIITIDLTVNYSNTGIDTQVACDSFTWIDGNTYTSSNTTATHTLTNAAGCDSIVTLDLTINNSTTGIDTQVACDSFTWIDGITYTSSNNAATFTLTNAVGCDSIVTLDLTINTVDASAALEADGITMTATVSGATYQWVDCADNSTISGATDQSYTATVNGDYAVIVTENGCTDTSACMTVSTVGVESLVGNHSMKLYPNPNEGEVFIDFGQSYDNVQVKVKDLSGKTVNNQTFKAKSIVNIMIDGASGAYLIEVYIDGNRKAILRAIRN